MTSNQKSSFIGVVSGIALTALIFLMPIVFGAGGKSEKIEATATEVIVLRKDMNLRFNALEDKLDWIIKNK